MDKEYICLDCKEKYLSYHDCCLKCQGMIIPKEDLSIWEEQLKEDKKGIEK